MPVEDAAEPTPEQVRELMALTNFQAAPPSDLVVECAGQKGGGVLVLPQHPEHGLEVPLIDLDILIQMIGSAAKGGAADSLATTLVVVNAATLVVQRIDICKVPAGKRLHLEGAGDDRLKIKDAILNVVYPDRPAGTPYEINIVFVNVSLIVAFPATCTPANLLERLTAPKSARGWIIAAKVKVCDGSARSKSAITITHNIWNVLTGMFVPDKLSGENGAKRKREATSSTQSIFGTLGDGVCGISDRNFELLDLELLDLDLIGGHVPMMYDGGMFGGQAPMGAVGMGGGTICGMLGGTLPLERIVDGGAAGVLLPQYL